MKNQMKYVLKSHSRPVIHMREQMKLKRFGLVFGSGTSQAFGFPSWPELITRIANHDKVDGENLLEGAGTKTAVSQLLFQKYKSNLISELPSRYDKFDRLNSLLQSGWHEILNEVLYRDVPKDFTELQERDPYIKEFVDIVKNTRLTVNYNFDDTLEVFLRESRSDLEKEMERGFRTVWNADIQLYPQNGVIYHPNGFLSRNFASRSSDNIIFLENDFGDQLVESSTGHYAALSYHLSQNTCLFIGLSLDDSTLKHILKKNSILHPGHIHYYIHFLRDENELENDQKIAIRDANFEVYNLSTLFLTSSQISALGRLLRVSDQEIDLIADEVGVPTSYRFFLTGSVSVGKSTAVTNFRSLRTHDEWLDLLPSEMGIDPALIDEDEIIRRIDQFVIDQWRAKNMLLSKSTSYGIHIVDRSPLDAFAFTPLDEWKQKAEMTLTGITPKKSKVKLVPGCAILLIGDPNVMAVRALKLQKKVKAKLLEFRQELLKVVFDSQTNGVIEVDTREKDIHRVVKEICRIIHIEHYGEMDFNDRLEDICSGKVKPPNELVPPITAD